MLPAAQLGGVGRLAEAIGLEAKNGGGYLRELACRLRAAKGLRAVGG